MFHQLSASVLKDISVSVTLTLPLSLSYPAKPLLSPLLNGTSVGVDNVVSVKALTLIGDSILY